jgi:hypothetical protein
MLTKETVCGTWELNSLERINNLIIIKSIQRYHFQASPWIVKRMDRKQLTGAAVTYLKLVMLLPRVTLLLK